MPAKQIEPFVAVGRIEENRSVFGRLKPMRNDRRQLVLDDPFEIRPPLRRENQAISLPVVDDQGTGKRRLELRNPVDPQSAAGLFYIGAFLVG